MHQKSDFKSLEEPETGCDRCLKETLTLTSFMIQVQSTPVFLDCTGLMILNKDQIHIQLSEIAVFFMEKVSAT